MNIKLTPFIITAALFTSGNSIAASPPELFDDIDTDASGCISKDEAKVRKDLKANFAKIDTDKNGTICVDEYTAYQNKGKYIPDEVEIPEVGAAPVM